MSKKRLYYTLVNLGLSSCRRLYLAGIISRTEWRTIVNIYYESIASKNGAVNN